jgi:predicted nucleic acid-binding protein
VPTPAARASRDDGYEVDVNAAVLGYTTDDQPVGIVSDDQRVRTTARGLGATVTGTVGVVVRTVEDGLHREEAHTLVRQIDSGSLRETAAELIEEAAHSTS